MLPISCTIRPYVGLFGTGPFGDSLLGPLGTVYWALWGHFTWPFRDSLLGPLGTVFQFRDNRWAFSGHFTGPFRDTFDCPQRAHLGTGPFRDSFGSHINFPSKLSPKGPLGYWAFWGHFLDPRLIRWISALSERNDKSDVVGFA